MESYFPTKKKRFLQQEDGEAALGQFQPSSDSNSERLEESTDIKLAMLMSLFPDNKADDLLELLVSCGGSVDATSALLFKNDLATKTPSKKRPAPTDFTPAIQTSLSSHILTSGGTNSAKRILPTKKGKTLHLFFPKDVAAYTPCTIIHNFLPVDEANALLTELLDESKHFSRYEFQLFNRTVQSPHTSSLYVSTPEEYRQQTSEYTYGGTYRSDVRQATPHLRKVSRKVHHVVNDEIQKRIKNINTDGKKLKYQSSKEWQPNAAFVNCYDGPAESVGFHSDQLTYIGPHPVIGSLSLGVEREFRVRRIIPRDEEDQEEDGEEKFNTLKPNDLSNNGKAYKASTARADAQGQISIHLPHNSLLIMHADMQEEWKHAIAPAKTVSPHPIAGTRRINITYRWYRDTLHPRYTPRCKCGHPTILRCAQRKLETRGRYMWMCYAGYAPGKEGCSFFQWAEFDDDGDPIWTHKRNEAEVTSTLTNFAASQ
ncbi:hypothetical protein N7462_006001 [Penicillium macrosclerotiorum]|uniref:uncharacterized protein n=1 Tax=Penicillium macrosclerotiorum TaxID=303699 RepID=UPI0025470BF3|nr:uncharacterized protein N7462_006001 [Penicillium macrosclerotiorum]KAJ5682836.1 hypothetical protein N7462_006001 [Penicillium macrosclerotiorum]